MKENNMFNLKKLAIEPTGNMPVCDAAGNEVVDDAGQPLSITFHSPGTKQFQKALHAFNERKSGGLKSLMGGKSEKTDPAEDTNALADFLAAVTISFNNFDYEGKVGHAAYRAAFADIEIGHVAEDANKYLGKRGNFLPKPANEPASQSGTLPG
jgi:hypothetical protein